MPTLPITTSITRFDNFLSMLINFIISSFPLLHCFDENKKNLEDNDIFIQFSAVNYATRLWINGTYCGNHEGNFLPFKFPIKPDLLKKTNYITVRVENFRKKNRIPTRSRDWFNWGGIYRDIDLFIYEKYRIDWVGVKITIIKQGRLFKIKCNGK